MRNVWANILIVTHAVTLRIIKGMLEDTLPVYPKKIANNGEIWMVEFKGLGNKHAVKSLFYGNSASMVGTVTVLLRFLCRPIQTK